MIPGLPDHVDGVRCFWSPGIGDIPFRQTCRRDSVDVWSYCLITNHGDFVLVPENPDPLSHALYTAYPLRFNLQNRFNSHLWQGRVFSWALDNEHLWAADPYVECNPWAGMVARGEECVGPVCSPLQPFANI